MKNFDAQVYMNSLSPEVQSRIRNCKSAEEIQAVLHETSSSAGVQELSMDELEGVSGGRGFIPVAMAAMMLFSSLAPLAAAAEEQPGYTDSQEPDDSVQEEELDSEDAFVTSAVMMTTASVMSDGMTASVLSIGKTVFGFAGKTLLTCTANRLANMALDPLFKMVFGIEDGPSNQDVIDEVDKVGEKLSAKMDVILANLNALSSQSAQYHTEEMNYLQAICSDIESKDFRQQADVVKRDNKECISVINRYHKGFTATDSGMIDDTTYRAYNNVLASTSCNMDGMKAHFDNMVDFINGEQYSNNMVKGYDGLTRYLHDKAVAAEKPADWNGAVDYNAVWDGIESEIRSMEGDLLTEYYLCLTLSYMKYKVDEYELGADATEEELADIAFQHEQYIEDLTEALNTADDCFTKVLKQNEDSKNKEIVCTVTLDDGTAKGLRSFAQGWSCAVTCGRDCTISNVRGDAWNHIDYSTLYRDYFNGVSNSGDALFTNDSGHQITVDLGNITMTGKGTLFAVGSNSGLKVNFGWVSYCDTLVKVKKDAKNVNVSVSGGTIQHYRQSPVVVESGATGKLDVRNHFEYPETYINGYGGAFIPPISNASGSIPTPDVSVMERDNPEDQWAT